MDIGGIALAGCILSLICLGLLAVFAFLLAQFAGTTLTDLLDSVTGGLGDNDADLDQNFQRKRDQGGYLPTRAEFRQRAQNIDFDEALAKYQGGNPDTDSRQQQYQAQAHDEVEERQRRRSSGNSDLRSPSISDNPDDPFGDVSTRNLRSQRSTRRSDGYEIYDDRDYDDDGGGFVDNMLDSF